MAENKISMKMTFSIEGRKRVGRELEAVDEHVLYNIVFSELHVQFARSPLQSATLCTVKQGISNE